MKRFGLACICALLVAAPARADITIKQSVAGKGLGMGAQTRTTTMIKGLKMRSEMVAGDTTRVTIFDVDTQKMYALDTKKKEADVWDMQTFGTEMAKSVQVDQMTVKLEPNGQQKTVAGKSADGYDLTIVVPSVIGGEKGMKMTVTLAGPMWIVKGAPGAADWMAFYKGAVEKGWIFSDPRAAKGAPGQAKAMAEMYRQLAATGGVAYEMDMTISLNGDGPMAGMMAKMGGVTMTTVTESVETGAIDASQFAVPAGFKLNERK